MNSMVEGATISVICGIGARSREQFLVGNSLTLKNYRNVDGIEKINRKIWYKRAETNFSRMTSYKGEKMWHRKGNLRSY